MTIFFPDISNHQGGLKIQPATVAVLAKATQGTGFADPNYADFKAQAAKVGAVFGAYHWIESGTPAEAAWVFKHVGKTPLMIDAEDPNIKTTVPMILGFVSHYRALGGVVHLVYLPHWYWADHLGSPSLAPLGKAGLRLVSSNYTTYSDTGPGWDAYGGATPAVWQYTDKLTYGGHSVDFNAFKGTAAQFKSLLTTGSTVTTSPPPKPKPAPTPATPTPAPLPSASALRDKTGHFSVTVDDTGKLHVFQDGKWVRSL